MKLPMVAVTSTSFSRSEALIAELEGHGFTTFLNSAGKKLAGQNLIAFLNASEAEVAIVGVEPVDLSVLKACPKLKFISKYGVGLDNLDQNAMTAQGVRLGWTGGVNKRSVSELVLGFAFGHCRNIFTSVYKMRRGEWDKNGGSQVSNKVIGIVGFGNIGMDLARILKVMGAQVLITDILDKTGDAATLGCRGVTYDQILREAQIISFHVPSTPLTFKMFGPKEIARCHPDTLVINTARGDIVDFEACCNAVRDGQLGGFASDVFLDEPADMRAWADQPHLYFTPHIGGNAREAILAMGRSAIAHVAAYYRQMGP